MSPDFDHFFLESSAERRTRALLGRIEFLEAKVDQQNVEIDFLYKRMTDLEQRYSKHIPMIIKNHNGLAELTGKMQLKQRNIRRHLGFLTRRCKNVTNRAGKQLRKIDCTVDILIDAFESLSIAHDIKNENN